MHSPKENIKIFLPPNLKERLDYAIKLGDKWDIFFLLEQHELLTGPEMVEIVSSMESSRLKILFDFANPITAGRDPLDDLMAMQKYIISCHCKDVSIIENNGNLAQKGVPIGRGDLNLPKLFFDLLMLGSDEPQVKYFALQMVVDYYAVGIRSENDHESRKFAKRKPSKTSLPNKLTGARLQTRLQQERDDTKEGFKYCKDLIANLRKIASDYIDQKTS